MYTSHYKRPIRSLTRRRHPVGIALLLTTLMGTGYVYGQSPGGVTPAAWYRADGVNQLYSDAGTTPAANGTQLYQWSEAQGTGYNLLQSTAARRPVFTSAADLANFNPTVTFDGANDFMQFTAGVGVNVIDRANGTLYAAGYVNVQKHNGFVGFHPSMDYPGLHEFTDNKVLFFTGGPGYQGKSADAMAAKAYFSAGAGWENGAGSSAGYAGATVSLNGTRTNYNGGQLYNANLSTGARDLRIGGDSNYGAFSGQLNEILVFDNRLTPTEMDQVESYLAVKYGSTYAAGTRDYKNASGSTVWTAASNAGYNHNIAGIANDGALNQKQSWSTNSAREVLISTTGLANTNVGNAITLTAGQYLIWGDNGLAKTPGVAITGFAGISHRFAAIWKVQNTGAVGTVRIAWVKTLTNLSLIQSTDAVISSADDIINMTSNEVTVNGVVYNYADVVLDNGEYFTFAAKVAAPGGVNGPAVWLKANEGTTLAGTSVSGWVNYGNSGGVAGQLPINANSSWALPKYGANEHNFNPAIIDDVPGTNAGGMLLEDVFPSTGNRPLSSFVLQSYNNVAAQTDLIAYAPLKQTSGALEAPFMSWYGANRLWLYWQDVYQNAPTLPNALGRQNNIASISSFYIPQWVSGTLHQTTVSMNGATATTPAYSINPTSRPFGNQLFIFGDGGGNNNSGGKISEVITYDKDLTTTEKLQVNSYLAIKYGITLTNNAGTAVASYLNSNADTVWNATANTGYNNAIAGIAYDENSALNQKQSKSNKAGQQLIIGTTGLNNTNVLNTAGLSNGQYLIWGDNGLGKSLSQPFTGVTTLNLRFAAIWKVQNTGSAGTVRITWPSGITNLTLVQSADAVFDVTDTRTDMTGSTQIINGVAYNYADVTLADGQFFTFAGYVAGPGGVGTDLSLWYKADNGITTNDASQVTEWATTTPNGVSLTPSSSAVLPYNDQTTYTSTWNFNPTVSFNGTNNYLRNNTTAYLNPAGSVHYIAVARSPQRTTGTARTLFTIAGNDDGFFLSGAGALTAFPTIGNAYNVAAAAISTPYNYGVYSAILPKTGSPANQRGFYNGLMKVYTAPYPYTGGTYSLPASGIGAYMGADGTTGDNFNGDIAEVVLYHNATGGDMLNTDLAKIHSYLALKYGITLDQTSAQNYVGSSSNVVWDAVTENTGYNNNIAGIARDDMGSLNQKQSRSVNAGQQVIIGTTGLESTNALNAVGLTNNQFLIWGDNGLVKSPTIAFATIGGLDYKRFASIWKVQNTGTVGTVRVAWPKGLSSLKLIQSADATIDNTDAITDMTNSQVVNGVEYAYADVTLENGQYFTFAAFLQAPGGVTNGLSHWYRADKYVQATGDGADVTSWTDFTSGVTSAQVEDVALPKFKQGDTTYFNFNPGINFTAANQSLANLNVQTVFGLNYDIFTLTKEGLSPGGNGRVFSALVNNDNVSGNINYWDGIGIMADNRLERMNTAYTNRYLANPGNITWATNTPSIMYNTFSDTTAAKGLNGAPKGAAGTHTTRGLFNGGHAFGTTQFPGNGSDNAGFTGNIGELVIYGTGSITAAERNKVDAYLAIKYGVTLNNTNNYTSSQDVVVWSAAANAGFYNNVAGIGQDFISALHQKQSRSQSANTNGQVIMSLNELATTNAENTGSVDNGQFLLWGDNNVKQAMTATASTYTTFSYAGGTNNGRRMNRIWKVQNTNVAQPMQVLFPRASVGTTTLPVGDACAAYAMLFADDSAMTTNITVVPLDITDDSASYIVAHAFPNGMSYFSFGKVTPLNNGNIYLPSVVESTTEYDNNCGVGEWVHYHQTGDATEKLFGTSGFGAADLDSLELTITPEGTSYDDGVRLTNLMPRVTFVQNNNSSPLPAGKVKVYYSADEMAATIVTGSATQGWFKYDGDAEAVLADVYGDGIFEAGKAVAITPAATGVENGVNYVVFDDISSFSSFVYLSSTENPGTVLPVNMLYFRAEKKAEQSLLSWATATEVKSSGFVVERSKDARAWTEIGFEASKATSNTELYYSFLDENPMNGNNFYRLKQLDIDGGIEYSQVKLVKFDKTHQLQILPNPANASFVIKGLRGNNTITMANVAGQVLVNTRAEGVGEQLIQIVHLPAGMYFVTVTNEDGSSEVHKVVKH